MNGRARLWVTCVVSLFACLALYFAGSGSLAAPSLGSWAVLEEWYAQRGAGTAIVGMVRLGALVASAWLCVASAMQVMAASANQRRVASLADACSPRFLRSLAHGAAGLSVTAGLAVPVLPGGAVDNSPGTAVMVPLDPTPSTSTTVERAPRIEPTTTTTALAPPTSPPAVVVPPPPPVPAAPHEVVVAPGDSFWSIATDEAGDRDLVSYWRALIELNRERLVDPTNPDLLYPDQVLVLP